MAPGRSSAASGGGELVFDVSSEAVSPGGGIGAPLSFESRFEGGNLARACRIAAAESVGQDQVAYELALFADRDTRKVDPSGFTSAFITEGTRTGPTEWYFFSVTTSEAPEKWKGGSKVRFDIVNITKQQCMHGRGMQPVVLCSATSAERGWQRWGEELRFYPNGFKSCSGEKFYTFSFVLDLTTISKGSTIPSITFWIAESFPYTGANLDADISSWLASPHGSACLKRELLRVPSSGAQREEIPIEVLTIDSGEGDDSQKPGVILMARVHPGECAGSWVIKGAIDFLLSEHYDAAFLRKNIVFKIVPMLNPEGVTNGMTRHSPSGLDFNRTWSCASPTYAPSIWAVKQMLLTFAKSRKKVLLSVDTHAHGKRMGTFMYGVNSPDGALRTPEPTGGQMAPLVSPVINTTGRTPRTARSRSRSSASMIPRLMAHYCTTFSLLDSTCHVPKSKESAARAVLCREGGIKNSYTLESSSCGSNVGRGMFTANHYSACQYIDVGRALGCVLTDLWTAHQLRNALAPLVLSDATKKPSRCRPPALSVGSLTRPSARTPSRSSEEPNTTSRLRKDDGLSLRNSNLAPKPPPERPRTVSPLSRRHPASPHGPAMLASTIERSRSSETSLPVPLNLVANAHNSKSQSFPCLSTESPAIRPRSVLNPSRLATPKRHSSVEPLPQVRVTAPTPPDRVKTAQKEPSLSLPEAPAVPHNC